MEEKRSILFVGIAWCIATAIILWSLMSGSLIASDVFVTAAFGLFWGYGLLQLIQYFFPSVHENSIRSAYALIFLLVLLLVGRVAFGYDGIEHIRDVRAWEVYYATVLLGAVLQSVYSAGQSAGQKSKKPADEAKKAYRKWNNHDSIIVVAIVCIAALSAIIGLNQKNFQNDQFFHVEAAKGYLETGQPVRWDFTADTLQQNDTGEPVYYKRSFTYTWQVAQSVQLFGWSEGAARIPSVVWFVLFVAGTYVATRRWSSSTTYAALFTLAFVFFDYLLLQSRITRMYSMLLAVGSGAMYMWYQVYKRSLARKFDLLFWGYSVIASLLLINGIFTHFLFFVFGFGFAAFLVYEALFFPAKEKDQRTVQRVWLALLAAAILCATLFIIRVWPFIFNEVGLVQEVRRRYELFIFADLPYQFFALGVYLFGVVRWLRSKQLSRRYVSVLSVAILLFFLFFVDRYQAMRYILFAIPLYWIIVFDTALSLFRRATDVLGGSVAVRRLVQIGLVVVFVLPLALPIPGLSDSSLSSLVQESRIIDTHAHEKGHNFEVAYEFIRNNGADVVYAQSFRTYYWQQDPALTVVDLGEDKELTLAAFKELQDEYGSGWVVWSAGKTHHLKPKVIEYIESTGVDYSTDAQLQGSNMLVYYLE